MTPSTQHVDQHAFTGGGCLLGRPGLQRPGLQSGAQTRRHIASALQKRLEHSGGRSGWTGVLAGFFACTTALSSRRSILSQRARRRVQRSLGRDSAQDSARKDAGDGKGAGPDSPKQEPAEHLESKMHELARMGRYEDAALVQNELNNVQVDDEVQVLSMNTELYAALSSLDLARMEALWLKAPFVQCIHMQERQTGYQEVCDFWKKLFKRFKETEESGSRRAAISAENVHMVVRGATAIVSCTEQSKFRSGRPPTQATNIFRKVDGKWHMVHRHVSHPMPKLDVSSMGLPVDDGLVIAVLGEDGADHASSAFDSALVRSILDHLNSSNGQVDQTPEELQVPRNPSKSGRGTLKSKVIDIEEDGAEDWDLSDTENESDDDEEWELAESGSEHEDGVEGARGTVRALRTLCKQGRLSDAEKTQLLREMLRNPGDSMPERAYQLLLAGVPESGREEAWEDFKSLIVAEVAATGKSERRKTK